MPYRRFILWNTAGATLWVVSMTLIGLLLGGIPFIVDNIDALMIVIVLTSVLPVAFAVTRKWMASRRARREEEERGAESRP